MNPIISFIGLDGSGKSTCVGHVYGELKNRGISVEIVRAAYVIKVMSFFIKMGKKILIRKNSDPFAGNYKAYLIQMRTQAQKRFVYKIFSVLTTCEFMLQIFFNIIMKNWLGKTLLVDRYIYDNVVTYAANLGEGCDYIRKTIAGKWKHAPKPDLIIYIKTPVPVCCSRKDDIPDPLYLEIREPLYDTIAYMYNVKTISGNQPLEQMLAEVMASVDVLLKNRGNE